MRALDFIFAILFVAMLTVQFFAHVHVQVEPIVVETACTVPDELERRVADTESHIPDLETRLASIEEKYREDQDMIARVLDGGVP